MHTLILIAAGFAVMLLFLGVAEWINRRRGAGFFDGGRLFIWFWLLAMMANMAVGLFITDFSLLTELAVFAIAFGLPAGAAWYLSRLIRRRQAPPSERPG
jgi:hypothetical protein